MSGGGRQQFVETIGVRTNFYTYAGVVKALNGVSIKVRNGETYALVGESGCGKSVSVRSIMRIVQSPGKIEDGEILIFFSEEQKKKAINILKRSETYMQSLRGNDISMIFQEASSSLNPVFTIGFQIGESIMLHRKLQILETTLTEIEEELKKTWIIPKLWKTLQRFLFNREIRAITKYEKAVAVIDHRLYEIDDVKDDKRIAAERRNLNNQRENLRKKSFIISIVDRVLFLKRYKSRLKLTVRKIVIELLDDLGIPNPGNIIDRYPHELSGGMQQRIVIAIALACHPQLLIADEPTSNLDVTIQAQILDFIKKLKETQISSVLFITHDLGVVAEICDRVTVMYAGDVCETATVKELYKNPLHPYTHGLLESVPKEKQTGALKAIPGTVPNLVHPPSGCRFHPRCPKSMDICKKQKPETVEYLPDHFVACHLYPKNKKESNNV